MLTIIVGEEGYNEATQEFEIIDPIELTLEHSLVSLSKWEAKYEKPFLASQEKTPDEIKDYIKYMILTPNVSDDILLKLSKDNLNEINDYIGANHTATTFNEYRDQKKNSRSEIVTSELIYYWMVTFSIPWEAKDWHLNNLFTLIRILNIKNSKQKPMSKQEIALRNRELNEQRKAQLGTKG